jgi:hypothetical protein
VEFHPQQQFQVSVVLTEPLILVAVVVELALLTLSSITQLAVTAVLVLLSFDMQFKEM